jgi:two-component sensor histidine kinase
MASVQVRLIQFLSRASLWRPSLFGGQAIAVFAVGLAAIARGAASPLLGSDVSFIMAVPAVLLATFFGGRLAGLTAIIAGSGLDLLIASQGGHLAVLKATPRLIVWLSSAAVVMLITVQLRAVLDMLRLRESELLAARDRLELLVHELEHRGRNALAIVQALSHDVARSSTSVAEYSQALDGRLSALALSYKALTRHGSAPVEVGDLVREALKPFGRQIKICNGPDCRIPAASSLPLSLALHELATNATKYGALSTPSGEVALDWTVKTGGVLDLHWVETGGPKLVAVSPEGFGSKLLRNVFRETPAGAFKALWRPQGMAFDISMQTSPDCTAAEPCADQLARSTSLIAHA